MKSGLTESYLLQRIEWSAEYASKERQDCRMRCFIASLCGALESDHPDVAKALALGAGMTHLYSARTAGE